MKTNIYLPAVAGILLLMGCATTSNQSKKAIFSFAFGDQKYEIISASPVTGINSNYLVSRLGNSITLRARDNDRDGFIDSVLTGDASLELANRIYSAGIEKARSTGKIRTEQAPRIYSVEAFGGEYLVTSSYIDQHNWINKLISPGAAGPGIIAVDLGADGVLDRIEKGTIDLDKAQKIYSRAIEEGIRNNYIKKTDGRFSVRQAKRSVNTQYVFSSSALPGILIVIL